MPIFSEQIVDDSGYQRPVQGATVSLYNSDDSLASTNSPNPVTTDNFGAFSFDAADGLYNWVAQIGGVIIARSQVAIGNPPQYIGPPGPADNTYTTLAALLASDGSRKSARLVPQAGDTTPAGNFSYIGGAWVRQAAEGITYATGSVASKLREFVSVIDYGAAVDGSSDALAAFNAAQAVASEIRVPTGIYRLNSRFTLLEGRRLVLQAGAEIRGYHSDFTIHMPWAKSIIRGAGGSSVIRAMQQPTGGAVVQIYAPNMSTRMGHDMVRWGISGVRIEGVTPTAPNESVYGASSGAPYACLRITNPQLDGKVCYFGHLENIEFAFANFGLWLHGWANGLRGGNFQFEFIGNTSLKSAAMYVHGALDNGFVNAFHHYSPETPSLLIEDLDNTAVEDGSLHVAAYSTFLAFQSEQGGVNTKAVVANANCTAFKNTIQIVDNTAGGYDISLAFRNNNDFWPASTGLSLQNADIRTLLQAGQIQARSTITAAGSFVVSGLGQGVQIREGVNGRMGVATLAGGTATVACSGITANTRIFLNHKTASGTLGHLSSTINPGVGFTVLSSSNTDTSTVVYELKEPS